MNATFYNQIIKSNAGTNSRNSLTNLVLENQYLLEDLIQISLTLSDKNHHKAVWIVEMLAESNVQILQPFTTVLIEKFSKYIHQSAVRGISRVSYFFATSNAISLTQNQEEKNIEYCLDGLIGDAKIAPKVYNMYTLSFYSTKHEWIKDELKNILEKDFASQSAGYKAAAREVLKKIMK